MKDKEKQIQEMQKIMEYCCNVYDDKGRHIRNKCNTFDCEYYCDTNNVCCSFSKKEATALYDAGYRKIPEDSIVLSKEEIEEEIDCAKCVMIRYDSDGTKCVSYDAYKEYTDRLGDNIKKLMAKIKLLEEEHNKASKETAEKIYLQAKTIVDKTKHLVQGREYLHIDALKELVKSCGVEIKE